MTCDHVVAVLGSVPVFESGLDNFIADFSGAVHFFNANTMRLELPHPGHLSVARFCGLCGKPLDFLAVEQKLQDALETHTGRILHRRSEYLQLLNQFFLREKK